MGYNVGPLQMRHSCSCIFLERNKYSFIFTAFKIAILGDFEGILNHKIKMY